MKGYGPTFGNPACARKLEFPLTCMVFHCGGLYWHAACMVQLLTSFLRLMPTLYALGTGVSRRFCGPSHPGDSELLRPNGAGPMLRRRLVLQYSPPPAWVYCSHEHANEQQCARAPLQRGTGGRKRQVVQGASHTLCYHCGCHTCRAHIQHKIAQENLLKDPQTKKIHNDKVRQRDKWKDF
jgi:hypothetical protein